MVVQLGGANCECDGKVWRVDVGMSSGVLNAEPQVRSEPLHSALVSHLMVKAAQATLLLPEKWFQHVELPNLWLYRA